MEWFEHKIFELCKLFSNSEWYIKIAIVFLFICLIELFYYYYIKKILKISLVVKHVSKFGNIRRNIFFFALLLSLIAVLYKFCRNNIADKPNVTQDTTTGKTINQSDKLLSDSTIVNNIDTNKKSNDSNNSRDTKKINSQKDRKKQKNKKSTLERESEEVLRNPQRHE